MNKKVTEIKHDVEKVDALMYVIEHTFLDLEVVPSERMKQNIGVNVFYALWDAVKRVLEDIEELEHDSAIVDVISAARCIRDDD